MGDLRIHRVRHHGKKADFSIATPNGDSLTATGSFREDGHNVGMVSYHPQLAAWIRLPACSLTELSATMKDAAHHLGGTLTVEYTALTDNLSALEPDRHSMSSPVQIQVETPAVLIGDCKAGAGSEDGPRDG
jgi:hypothetical protein